MYIYRNKALQYRKILTKTKICYLLCGSNVRDRKKEIGSSLVNIALILHRIGKFHDRPSACKMHWSNVRKVLRMYLVQLRIAKSNMRLVISIVKAICQQTERIR
jgi:hypothetical protein